jgi:2-polyprenyl-6-hydroxyphenyl methylase/3-demethylubiquinone-9 3-methyltransferase
MVWAELGHRVHGLDINQPLLELARERATASKMVIDFRLGSSTEMPWANDSMDICLLLELLEHVTDWQGCIRECSRILRRNGILVITTTNKLCPFQREFNLPFYSWYPSRLKRYCENLASTSRPALANYATYPAVNWFTFYSLKDSLSTHGFDCKDRFDMKDLSRADALTRTILRVVQKSGIIRLLAHMASPGTIIVGVKSGCSLSD